jgi:adenosylcobyric acid synthase
VHGIFDDDRFRHTFIDAARHRSGLAPAQAHIDVTANRERRIDRWADHLRQSLDLTLIRDWVSASRALP